MKKVVTILLLTCVICIMGIGCTNPSTPAGSGGYVIESPRFFGKGGFIGIIKGPGNFGASIYNNVVKNIDLKPKTYSESFKIVVSDGLEVQFSWQSVIMIKSNGTKSIVEDYGGKEFYQRYIQKPLRSFVRKKVQGIKAMEIKSKQSEMIDAISIDIEKYFNNTPFVLVSGAVGNIKYPDKIISAIEDKLAAIEVLATKDTLRLVAIEDAKIKEAEAAGIAKAQKIINGTLTELYLQHEAIEAMKIMAGSPNHTTQFIPIGNSGIPIVKTIK